MRPYLLFRLRKLLFAPSISNVSTIFIKLSPLDVPQHGRKQNDERSFSMRFSNICTHSYASSKQVIVFFFLIHFNDYARYPFLSRLHLYCIRNKKKWAHKRYFCNLSHPTFIHENAFANNCQCTCHYNVTGIINLVKI